jgi:hypothetical protein
VLRSNRPEKQQLATLSSSEAN